MASFKVSSVLRPFLGKHLDRSPSRPRAKGAVLRSCAALLLIAGLAGAQTTGHDAQGVANLIEKGAVDRALPVIKGELAGQLALYPGQALVVCAAAAENVERHTKRSPGKWPELADTLIEIGGSAVEAYEYDGDALAAHAEAFLCRARLFAHSNQRGGDPQDWARSFELYIDIERNHPQEGAALRRALGIVREASECGALPLVESLEKAAACADQAARDYPGDDCYREIAHRIRLQLICRSLKENRSQGKKALKAYLARFQAQMARTPDDQFAVTAYNDTVTLAKREKVPGVRAKYKTRTVILGKRLLALTIPDGKRWTWTKCSGYRLTQSDLDGRPLRSISLSVYGWR